MDCLFLFLFHLRAIVIDNFVFIIFLLDLFDHDDRTRIYYFMKRKDIDYDFHNITSITYEKMNM